MIEENKPQEETFAPNFEFEKYHITREDVINDAHQLARELQAQESKCGLFVVKSAEEWLIDAQSRPVPRMLFGEMWHEGELCILFADTNLGKSILAVQIGNSISKGQAIKPFRLEAEQQPILYFDFELSDKQFENRYSVGYQYHYQFNNLFKRIEIDPNSDVPNGQSFEDYLNSSLEEVVARTGAKILIIDNITYLRNETESARDALPLMKHLKALKNKYNLSILALAHTPKRDGCKPISRNDLQGSKMLINFCDSSFAVGESNKDKELRYLKQIKQRNTEQIYDTENVCVCKIEKPDNFLQFHFLCYGDENEHLASREERDVELKADVLKLRAEGLSIRDIAEQLGVSRMKVHRRLK